MTHFSLSNMDYTPVRFMIKCFEANYPESLGAVLVHKAPFIFSTIWNIIKGWLDPVVASKVHFTKGLEDLEEFIPKCQILKELGGDEDWEYQFSEPVPEENKLMSEEAPRIKLEAERKEDVLLFQQKTFEWIATAGGADSAAIKSERDAVAKRLQDDYWQLDPYIRARTIYDRMRMIQGPGEVNFYPDRQVKGLTLAPAAAVEETGNANTNDGRSPPVQETSAGDVD